MPIRMIDISDKKKTQRAAVASCVLKAPRALLKKIKSGSLKKGDCLAAGQAAGILSAKNTPGLIPLCHPVALTHVAVDFVFMPKALRITAVVRAHDATGVEMEALAACAVAALTIYDMAKADDPDIVITGLRLIKKTGGKSDYKVKK